MVRKELILRNYLIPNFFYLYYNIMDNPKPVTQESINFLQGNNLNKKSVLDGNEYKKKWSAVGAFGIRGYEFEATSNNLGVIKM